MIVLDKYTNNVLESNNEFVIETWKADKERFEEVKKKSK